MGQKGSKGLTKEQKELIYQEKQIDHAIKQQLAQDHAREQRIYKLLLLGAGESGKSTLFKQINSIYGSGITEKDRRDVRERIFQNITQAMFDLVDHCDAYGVGVAPQNHKARDFFLNVDTTGFAWTEQHAQYAKQLWVDPAVQTTWQHHKDFHVAESAAWFFERIDVISEPDYIPSQDDYLRIRARTTGIVQSQFTIDRNVFHIFDVGGQRNERKKWIHAFDSVTAVIFVAAISEYDQNLFEDDSINRLEEAITLFDEQVNSKWFTNTAILLFLNKSDLFREKIASVPLKQYFPQYPGEEGNFEQMKDWIVSQFLAKRKNPQKVIYHHVTCATDTDNVRLVFDVVKDILIRASLSEAGLH